ncbi:MAG: TIGR03758 family integrating conjugative element protein [Methylomicrobium sp.]|nr:TIGR03758 family integrating conjugative element protein [Methylomicrobium sp.]
MTNQQAAAFTQATGNISNPEQLLLGIAVIFAVIYLLWLVWITKSQYQAWQTRKGDFYDMTYSVLRAIVVVLLVGYFIR